MLVHRSIGHAAILLAALMLLTLIGVSHLPGRIVDRAPGAVPAGVLPATGGPPALTYHANLFANDSAPSGAFPPNETVSVTYLIQVVGSPSGAIGAKVGIPSSLVQLSTSSTPIRLHPAYVEATISTNGSALATPGPSTHLSNSLSFNATGNAFFSTQGVAVMASWPYGQFAVQFQWRWVLTPTNGTPTTGPWSNPATVSPTLLAKFATPPSSTWVNGAPYALCLTGPLTGRTFSVHVSIANPVQQFDDGAVLVSGHSTSSFCWNSTLPAGLQPQQAFIHLWEYSDVSYLLFVILVQIVNGTGTTVGGAVSGATVGWLPFAYGGGVVATVVFVLGVILLFSSQRRRRRAAASPAGVASPQPPPVASSPPSVRPLEPAPPVVRPTIDRPRPAAPVRRDDAYPTDRRPAATPTAVVSARNPLLFTAAPEVRTRESAPSMVPASIDRPRPAVPDRRQNPYTLDRRPAKVPAASVPARNPLLFSPPPEDWSRDPPASTAPPRVDRTRLSEIHEQGDPYLTEWRPPPSPAAVVLAQPLPIVSSVPSDRSREPAPSAVSPKVDRSRPKGADRREDLYQTEQRPMPSPPALSQAWNPSLFRSAPETEARKSPPVTIRTAVHRPPPSLLARREDARSREPEPPMIPEEPQRPPLRDIASTAPASPPLAPAGPPGEEPSTPSLGLGFPDRVSTGTPRLNELLRGGLPLNAHVLLVGDPFLGKEVALYSFIADGLRRGESAVLITATRGPEEVRLQMIDVFPAFEQYERSGRVQWIDVSGPSGDGGSPSHARGAIDVNGPDDYAGILRAVVLSANRADSDHPGRLRIGFLGLGAALSHGRGRDGFAFLQNLVAILKRRRAIAMYTVEGGTLTEADLERLLTRMDGAIRFKREQNKTSLSVVGIGEVATREWVEYRATNRALIVGSFSLERIR